MVRPIKNRKSMKKKLRRRLRILIIPKDYWTCLFFFLPRLYFARTDRSSAPRVIEPPNMLFLRYIYVNEYEAATVSTSRRNSNDSFFFPFIRQ